MNKLAIKASALACAVLVGIAGAQAADRTWRYSYNALGLPTAVDGPRTDVPDVMHYAYDAQGNLTAITNALGHVTRLEDHDHYGNPQTIADPNGVVTALTYTPEGWLASTTTAGITTRFDYDPIGQLTRSTRGDGSYLDYSYDGARRLVAVSDGLGNRVDYVLDAAGNRLEEQIQDQAALLRYARTQFFDELSRLRRIAGLDGAQIFDYDLDDNLAAHQDGRGNPIIHLWDGLNRLLQTTDAHGGHTAYGYDASDNLTSVQDPKGNETVYTYDGLGNRIRVDSPDTGTTRYVHDSAGNLVSRTDANGTISLHDYDALNRLKAIRYTSGIDQSVQFFYDEPGADHGVGRLTRVVEAFGETSYSYDPRGELTTETRVVDGYAYTVGYEYDAAGRVVAIAYPSGRVVTFARDAAGRVTAVTGTKEGIETTLASQIGYLPFGPVDYIAHGNGLVTTRQFDTTYRIRHIGVAGLLHRDYGYYGNDDVAAIVEPLGTDQRFDYDGLRRLTDATGSYGQLLWSYDGVGNRLSEARNGNPISYNVDAASNRLLSLSDGTTYTYDAVGNILIAGSWSLTYDSVDRLRSVSQTGTPVATYRYNYLSQRVSKSVGGDTTVYLYDREGHLLAEVDGTMGATRVEYVWLDDLPLAIIHIHTATPGTYFVHTDHLHTPQAVTDIRGTVVWQAIYSPFGHATLTAVAIIQNLRLPGQYFDAETGLHYNWHRYYDPATGRYITSDPIGLAGGVNTYAYVYANPISLVDPLGLDATICLYPGAGTAGHVGIGINSSSTVGFYPRDGGLRALTGTPGEIKRDEKAPERCKTIKTSAEDDKKMSDYIAKRTVEPENYSFAGNNCTNFVRSVLQRANIQTPVSPGPRPYFEGLRGKEGY